MSRIFKTFSEAEEEIKRELAERSIMVHPETMQDKIVADNIDYLTREVQNFQYTVTQPNTANLNPTQPWADIELEDRLSQSQANPGRAYATRSEVWQEFLEESGQFSYSYPERLGSQLWDVVNELMLHPNSRQLFVSIWDREIDPPRRGRRRVPCSLGYYYLYRQGRLDVTYTMRSCDFVTHWQNDVWLARKIQEWVAEKSGMQPGLFSQIVFSLHVYAKDVEGVF